jgi:uncharacterized membrane protein YsdA (DUF1294 family)
MTNLAEIYYNHLFLSWYFLIINLLTFFIYGLDKAKSAMGSWRVSERKLLSLAILGGSVGAIFGIKLFRHKTRKTDFLLPLGIILFLQVVLIYLLFFI